MCVKNAESLKKRSFELFSSCQIWIICDGGGGGYLKSTKHRQTEQKLLMISDRDGLVDCDKVVMANARERQVQSRLRF